MADPAHDASRLAEERVAQLARLRWALRSQAARAGTARSWVNVAATPSPPARLGLPFRRPPAPAPASPRAELVAPPMQPPAVAEGERRLRVVVSEERRVSLELESRIRAPAPEIVPRHRLAS
jgi:hypothetical protein